TGVRLVPQDCEGLLAGMPLIGADGNTSQVLEDLQKEVREVLIETDAQGIIAKADSLGSLEALMTLLKDKGIPVRKSSIGPISKKDISDAEALIATDPLNGIIIGFNIPKPDVETSAHILINDVIYRLIEDYEAWKVNEQKKMESSALDVLIKPCKVELLKGYVFRQNNPAIAGVEVLAGTLRSNTPLMNSQGKALTLVKGIQIEQENVDKAEKGKRPAVSMPGVTIGRQIVEGETLYSMIPEEQFRKYKEHKELLSEDEKNVLKEIAEIMRKNSPVWGI
ncbi:MAG TPA: translation initiation factor IF-2, partial [Candidatus Nanoarchaeia archaeon]|nr:translation initiation factor IF-2 [Candidatus Nanoarchaeia archaeon]